MTVRYQQEGKIIQYSNAGSAISAGDIVKMGCIVGVALEDIAASTGVGSVCVEGVVSGVPKTTGTAWTVGLKLLWDVSATKFDSAAATPATGDITGCAIAWEAASSGATTGTIKLGGFNNAVT